LSIFDPVTVMSERLVVEYYLEHLRDPPEEPVPDPVASAAIEEFFDDPYLPIVNEREVFVEGVSLVHIKQESVYSNKDTQVLKPLNDVEEVAGSYLQELFVELSTGEDKKSPILSGKRAANKYRSTE
jgi:hypothetical protein